MFEVMDALERGALVIVRIVAGTLLLWSVMDLTLYLFVCQHNQEPVKIYPCITNSLPMLVGIAMFIKSKAIAQWIYDKLD
jgi:hypothetical protein